MRHVWLKAFVSRNPLKKCLKELLAAGKGNKRHQAQGNYYISKDTIKRNRIVKAPVFLKYKKMNKKRMAILKPEREKAYWQNVTDILFETHLAFLVSFVLQSPKEFIIKVFSV